MWSHGGAEEASHDGCLSSYQADRAVHEYSLGQFGYTEDFLKAEFKEYRNRYGFE